MRRALSVTAALVLAVCLTSCEPVPVLSVQVVGRVFVDQNWKKIQLRGVNRPGLEYRCTAWAENPDWAGFITDADQPTGGGRDVTYAQTVVDSFDSWPGINAVRLPLNEGCWLGTMPGPFSGQPYRDFVRALVDALTASGRYTVLDLHWSAPKLYPTIGQDVGPNREHSLPFWTQVATEFKDTPSVMFDLFNEPRIWCWTPGCYGNYSEAVAYSWGCYRDGCVYTYKTDDHALNRFTGDTIDIVGTQELTEAIRNTGARNVVIVEGLGWGNALDNWWNYRITDLINQYAASIHTYPSSGANANGVPYLDASIANATTKQPLLLGEFGEQVCPDDTRFAERTTAWADEHGYSWTAWGWDSGEGCWGPSLVTNNETGDPHPYGLQVKAALAPR